MLQEVRLKQIMSLPTFMCRQLLSIVFFSEGCLFVPSHKAHVLLLLIGRTRGQLSDQTMSLVHSVQYVSISARMLLT